MTPEELFTATADLLLPSFDQVTQPLSHYETMEMEEAFLDSLKAMIFKGNATDLLVFLAPHPTLLLELARLIRTTDLGLAA